MHKTEPLKIPKLSKQYRINAFIQARTTSVRFPGKIYKDINGAPMLYHTVDAAKRSKLINKVVLVSPKKLPDIPPGTCEFIHNGSENDVLSRYWEAMQVYPCDYVVRLTSDCPILDPNLIDFVIANSIGSDYGSNVLILTFPDGQDVEVMSAKTLEWLNDKVDSGYDREHVTTKIRNDARTQVNFDLVSVQAYQDQSYIKISVDTEEDLERVRLIEKEMRKNAASDRKEKVRLG